MKKNKIFTDVKKERVEIETLPSTIETITSKDSKDSALTGSFVNDMKQTGDIKP